MKKDALGKHLPKQTNARQREEVLAGVVST